MVVKQFRLSCLAVMPLFTYLISIPAPGPWPAVLSCRPTFTYIPAFNSTCAPPGRGNTSKRASRNSTCAPPGRSRLKRWKYVEGSESEFHACTPGPWPAVLSCRPDFTYINDFNSSAGAMAGRLVLPSCLGLRTCFQFHSKSARTREVRRGSESEFHAGNFHARNLRWKVRRRERVGIPQ